MERCPYCFKPLPENGICNCHYEESENARIEDALRPGTIVGAAYQIGAVLGKGGFGITYRAFDLNMESVVAIKEFYPDGMVIRAGLVNKAAANSYGRSEVLALTDRNLKTYRKSLELFYREAAALGKLKRTPNVVHAYQFFRENGTAYIVMEFVEGQSLKSLIRERGRIPEAELLPLLDPILIALGKVHEAGIIHRDIAPDNIMIENGQPILLDFGAARVEEGHASSLLIGKKGYSSPEQMAGGEIDRRSDIYSLGATYYKALTGVTPQESGLRALNDEVVPPKDLVPEISQSVSDAVMKAMSVGKDQRFESAEAFREALNKKDSIRRKSAAWAEAEPVKKPDRKVQAGDRQPENRDSAAKPKSKGKTGWILAAVLLILAAAGVYFFKDRIISEPTPTVDTAALTQTVLDVTHTAEEALARTREAERVRQTETAVRAAEYAAQTETAFYEQKEAELRQTATKSAENRQATQAYFESRTEEAGIKETQNVLGTRQAAEATEAAAAWLATQQAELALTQTQDALNYQHTGTAAAQQTAWAEGTAAAVESTRQAEQRQTKTRSAMDQQSTQTAWAEGTAVAAESTRQAEQRQTETKTAMDQQSTQTAWSEGTAAAAENTRQAEQRQTALAEQTADAVRAADIIEQTQQAVNIMQTQLVETQAAMGHIQTEAAQKSTQAAIELVRTQSALLATQTKAAEPTAANTLQSTATPQPTVTKPPQPTAVPLSVGDMIKFGRYEQDNNKNNGMEAIEWQVLAVEKGRALVISRYGLDAKPYNEKYVSVTWETCTLRAWLNGEFYDTAFSPEEKRQIIEVTNENPDNPKYGTKGDNRTKDRIFLLSIDEAEQYFSSTEERKCYATDYAKVNGASVNEFIGGTSFWWLRSPGSFDSSASSFADGGSVDTRVDVDDLVARPAFWLNTSVTADIVETQISQDENTIELAATLKPTATKPPQPMAVPLSVGDMIKFGRYEQDNNKNNGMEAIEWQVLAVEKGRALVISRYALDAKRYNEKRESVTWETSTLRAWLNGEFYDTAFSPEEKRQIIEVTNENPDNPKYGTKGGNRTKDSIFLLSIDEVKQYFASDEERKCFATDYAKENGGYVSDSYGGTSWWWLRSPGYIASNAATVYIGGSVRVLGDSVYVYTLVARPAFWLNTSVIIDNDETQTTQDVNTIEPTATPQPTATKPPQPTAVPLRVGDMIKFGRYEQDNDKNNGMEAIEWQVLAVEKGRALVISRYGLDAKPYNEKYVSVTWETCTLRAWLNGEFYDIAFSPEEKRQIIEVTNENSDNPKYGTKGGSRTKDRIFLLSIDEAEQYFSSTEERKCYATDYANENGAYVSDSYGGTSWWWLRSPGSHDSYAANVYDGGSVDLDGYNVDFIYLVARPAFWLNL